MDKTIWKMKSPTQTEGKSNKKPFNLSCQFPSLFSLGTRIHLVAVTKSFICNFLVHFNRWIIIQSACLAKKQSTSSRWEKGIQRMPKNRAWFLINNLFHLNRIRFIISKDLIFRRKFEIIAGLKIGRWLKKKFTTYSQTLTIYQPQPNRLVHISKGHP